MASVRENEFFSVKYSYNYSNSQNFQNKKEKPVRLPLVSEIGVSGLGHVISRMKQFNLNNE